MRSQITIDLGALGRNVTRLLEVLGGAELWAVVKADAYGHGAVDCARAALDAGARAVCVGTLGEAIEIRHALPTDRILVFGPVDDLRTAREARLELCVSGDVPEDIAVHVKLDTGMGRWGVRELVSPARNVVGLMTHFATADSDPAFAREQLARFEQATADYTELTRHAANSAATLRLPETHLDAARCGVALYGLSPFGTDPAEDGLEPVLGWRSELALVKELAPGESTGYGRRFVTDSPTWIGLVPVGYADGFRRGLSGTTVLVAGEPCEVIGVVSMDAFAVALPGPLPVGTPVTIVGPGASLEAHARSAGTINYELATQIRSDERRAERLTVYS